MRENSEIVKLIKKEVETKGISMSELSRRVGLAKSAVSRYFNESREFPLNKADDFAKALGISTEYLLGFEEEDSKPSKNINTIAAHIDDNVTEEEMEEIVRYIEFIKSKHDTE